MRRRVTLSELSMSNLTEERDRLKSHFRFSAVTGSLLTLIGVINIGIVFLFLATWSYNEYNKVDHYMTERYHGN